MARPKKPTNGDDSAHQREVDTAAVALKKALITDTPERRVSLEALISSAEAQIGKGAIMHGEGAEIGLAIDYIPTDDPDIDGILANGKGIPRGRMIEIYGPESSGKTTLALTLLAAFQRAGGRGAFVDMEHALDPEYATALGVDLDEVLVSQPDNGEQALDLVEMFVKSRAVDVVILDSVAALVTKAELEGDMGDAHVGLTARLMSQAMRKLTAAISQTNCTVIFINQLRSTIQRGGMGPTETTTGGRALKFAASIRLDIRKIEQIKVGEEVIGHIARVKTPKNKVFRPFKQVDLQLRYPVEVNGKLVGAGFDRFGGVLDRAVLKSNGELILKSGAWYALNDHADPKKATKIGQGREAARKWLIDNPAAFEQIRQKMATH